MNPTPREPFDAEEARIARLYEALPRGEPSSALDARILAQARSAVAANAPARRRPWFLGAGLGTAAAAVFAAGIAWQLGAFKEDRGLSGVPEQAPAMQEELDRVDIEFVRQEAKLETEAEPPVTLKPSAVGEAREQQAGPAAVDKSRADAAEPFPAETAAPVVLDEPAPLSVAAPPPAPPAPPQSAAAPAPAAQTAAPDAALEDAAAAPVDADADADARTYSELESLSRERAASELGAVSGRRAQPAPAGAALPETAATNTAGAAPRDEPARRSAQLAKQAGLPPWAEDVALAPEPWLERIRDRVQAGDRQGAEHSLRRFVLAHPDRRVPRDLQRLLVE